MPELSTCATCNHWTRHKTTDGVWGYDPPEDWGSCAVLANCGGIQPVFHVDSSWLPPFDTHQDFGCVLHETADADG